MIAKDMITSILQGWVMRHPCTEGEWWHAQNLLGDVLGWPEWYGEEVAKISKSLDDESRSKT